MNFISINLIYFCLASPVILIAFYGINKLNQQSQPNYKLKILVVSIALFIVRVLLVLFKDSIGIMPYLIEDIVFYGTLTTFGLGITYFFIRFIEKTKIDMLDFKCADLKKNIAYTLLGFIPLILMFPLILNLTNIAISYTFTFGKVIVALCFVLLGACYEEIMFRGFIQDYFSKIFNKRKFKIVLSTALTFTLTHIFYLPFTGFGIYYIFVFNMAFILSILKIYGNLIPCALLHGGIVFILIIFV